MKIPLLYEFEHLAGAVLDGTAAESQRQRFNALLRASPELSQLYFQQARLHAALTLHGKGGAQTLGANALAVRRSPLLSIRFMKSVVKLAAALALLAGGLAVGLRVERERPLATLENVSGTVTLTGALKDTALRTGMTLYSGNEVAVNGGASWALLRWKDGTMLKLGHKTRVMLTQVGTEKRITLLAGTLEGNFTKQQQGNVFVIVTAQGRARVRGTILRVSANPRDTRLSVIEGAVQFDTHAGKFSALVTSRQEVSSASIENGKLKVTRLVELDRFSGGRSGGPALAMERQLSVK